MRPVDLNADVGEGGDDDLLYSYLTSVSIACGGHAGDAESMRRTLIAASAHGLRLGAHPGYPDRAGFGRLDLGFSPDQVRETVMDQLQTLTAIAGGLGLRLTHVKVHGALYNRAWVDAPTAKAIVEAIAAVDPRLRLFCPPGSAQLAAAAERGLVPVREVFADRGYDEAGRLLPRGTAGAVLTDPRALPDHLRELGPIPFETMCVHGDNPAALTLLRRLHEEMPRAGLEPKPY